MFAKLFANPLVFVPRIPVHCKFQMSQKLCRQICQIGIRRGSAEFLSNAHSLGIWHVFILAPIVSAESNCLVCSWQNDWFGNRAPKRPNSKNAQRSPHVSSCKICEIKWCKRPLARRLESLHMKRSPLIMFAGSLVAPMIPSKVVSILVNLTTANCWLHLELERVEIYWITK